MTDKDKALIEYRTSLPQTPEALLEQRQRVNDILKAVMQPGVHYDVIGRRLKQGEKPKPGDYSLLKPGAELLLQTFHIGTRPRVEDISQGLEVAYRVYSDGIHLPTGHIIGTGVGECSSREEKYAWREAVCAQEFDMAPQGRRRIKFKTTWQNNRPAGHVEIMQVRQDPQDQANTILKMAKKRAEVDLVRTALSVSDLFSEPGDGTPRSAEAATAPRSRASSYEDAAARYGRQRPSGAIEDPPLTVQPNQIKIIRNSLNSCGVAEEDLLHRFQVDALESLPFPKINEALEWIRSQVAGGGNNGDG